MLQPDRQASPPTSSEFPSGKPNPHTSDHLANERTFLAWLRTSIAVLGLGFVVAKFSVWLRELSARLDEPVQASHTRLSLPLGVSMMAVGGLLAVVAAWRYRRVRIAIDRGVANVGSLHGSICAAGSKQVNGRCAVIETCARAIPGDSTLSERVRRTAWRSSTRGVRGGGSRLIWLRSS